MIIQQVGDKSLDTHSRKNTEIRRP
jgi:hypothetical protein